MYLESTQIFLEAYWHDDDFGMGRYSTHDDKAGKKIWIWGLSQQGMIWEKLLTDTDGQYVEVQAADYLIKVQRRVVSLHLNIEALHLMELMYGQNTGILF